MRLEEAIYGIQERQAVTKSALLAILGGVVAAVAITLNFVFEGAEQPPSPPEAASSVPAEPPAKTLSLKPEDEPKDILTRPDFDIVRINPAGDTVMAGRLADWWKFLTAVKKSEK